MLESIPLPQNNSSAPSPDNTTFTLSLANFDNKYVGRMDGSLRFIHFIFNKI